MCEHVLERMPTLSAKELSETLSAIERASSAIVNANGLRATLEKSDGLEDFASVVAKTLARGEKYLFESEMASNSDAKAREVLEDLDKWVSSRAERGRTWENSGKMDDERWASTSEADVKAALAELERQFPERPRAKLIGIDDDDVLAAGKKRREEVLLEIDSALSSLTSEDAVVVAKTVGDGSAAFYVKPMIDFIQGQSDFVRKSIAVAIACTVVAVTLIEFFVEERSSELVSLGTAGADLSGRHVN